MIRRVPAGERRTFEQLKQHYLVEKRLAERLRNASKEERRHLYTALYDELFQQIPFHPMLAQKADEPARSAAAAMQLRFLKHFLRPESVFLEVGPGDCGTSFQVAKLVKKVYAVDVSNEITRNDSIPGNFELIISDGSSIPVPENSIDVAYSDQLMEHLHPDDALDQLRNIYTALKPGGIYLCVTPNRFSGPHDISEYFDDVATCFHLKEYTTTELVNKFQAVGFSDVRVFSPVKGFLVILPVLPIIAIERVLSRLPRTLSKSIAGRFPVRQLLSKVVATK